MNMFLTRIVTCISCPKTHVGRTYAEKLGIGGSLEAYPQLGRATCLPFASDAEVAGKSTLAASLKTSDGFKVYSYARATMVKLKMRLNVQ